MIHHSIVNGSPVEAPDISGTIDINHIINGDNLEVWENSRLKKWLSLEKFIIFGTGGSSLGGQCLHGISKMKDKLTFVNNLDPHTLKNVLGKISPHTGFLCISKSGETMETVAQLLLILGVLERSEISSRVVVITENKSSSLREIAAEYDCLCVDYPKNIGGRFSVFSIVGMLPAFIGGTNPQRIRSGARQYLETSRNFAQNGARFVAGHSQHVSFIYSDKLSFFGAWLAQLYAESTGKSGVGVTPLTAMGSFDQHSQLQLYLDGPSDKCFTFFLEKQKTDLAISSKIFVPHSFSYIKNKNIADIFEAQHNATLESLVEKGVPLRKIEFPELTPEILGALLAHFIWEVIAVCHILKVNAFDQPAVERGKIITNKLLGAI
jgi:glucose-6-phosphate isomerase